MKIVGILLFIILLSAGAVVWVARGGEEIPAIAVFRKPTPTMYSPMYPPSDSLGGLIASFSGEVFLEERMATEAARITESVPVLQGEAVKSGQDGEFVLEYAGVLTAAASPSSELEAVQTLPDNLVFYQKAGTVSYGRRGDNPVTVRFRRFIAELGHDASMSASIDPVTGDVSLDAGGTIIVGYNDADFISHVETIPAGSQWVFSDERRMGEFQ